MSCQAAHQSGLQRNCLYWSLLRPHSDKWPKALPKACSLPDGKKTNI